MVVDKALCAKKGEERRTEGYRIKVISKNVCVLVRSLMSKGATVRVYVRKLPVLPCYMYVLPCINCYH